MGAFRCHSCEADWSGGEFTDGCEECGGGAMSRACLVCEGRCGAEWSRAPMDSNDEGTAHWVGGCALPREEQQAIFAKLAARTEGEDDTPQPPSSPVDEWAPPRALRWAAALNLLLGITLLFWTLAMIVTSSAASREGALGSGCVGTPMALGGLTVAIMGRRMRRQVAGLEPWQRRPAVIAATSAFLACLPGLLMVGVLLYAIVQVGGDALFGLQYQSWEALVAVFCMFFSVLFLPLAILNAFAAVRTQSADEIPVS